MGLAAPRQAERQKALGGVDKAALAERRQGAPYRRRQPLQIEGRKPFVVWQLALAKQTLDAVVVPIRDLDFRQVEQVALEAPTFPFRLIGDLRMGAHEAWKLE